MNIKIKLLHPAAVMPTKAKAGDAAYDLTAVSCKQEKDYIEYGLGVAFEVPEGYVALIYPRSSVSTTPLFLANGVGVIDSGYRGEVKARFKIKDYQKDFWQLVYQVGERVAQVIFQKLPDVTLVEASELSDSERGEGGFGSSGR